VRTKWAKKSRTKRQRNGLKLEKCLNESSFDNEVTCLAGLGRGKHALVMFG